MKSIVISKDLFIKNRSKLKEAMLPNSSAVVFSAGYMPRNGDQYYKFRQNSDFFYLSGINQEDSVLILNPEHPEKKYREVLLIKHASPEMITWNGYKLSKQDAAEISGIESVFWLDEFERLCYEIIPDSENLYLNLPENSRFIPPLETYEMRKSLDLQKKFPLHRHQRLFPILQNLRMIKEPEEAELIRVACGITRDTFNRLLTMIKPGIYEYEIEAEMTAEFLRRGSAGHAYDPIVASGKDACILHYTDNGKKCSDGELLLMDFGTEWGNYASDCSRTIPVNGKFSPRQAEMYDGLLEVFYQAREMMIPGVLMSDFHEKVCKLMEQLHIRLGLYTDDDALNYKGSKGKWFQYYMHGTSHSLGLDVHDVFDKSRAFAPGMVLTCEPGIYVEEENTGIRIENDIMITENGNIDLMEDIPIKREDIEKLMQN